MGNGVLSNIDPRGLRTVAIIYYLVSHDGVHVVTESSKQHLKNILANAFAGLTRDKVAALFRDREPEKDELGTQYTMKVGWIRARKDCLIGYGIQVNQRKGSKKSPPGYASDRKRFAIYKTALDDTASYAEDNRIPFNRDITTANVMAHESLFHNIAGKSDSIKEKLTGSYSNPDSITSGVLTPYLVANEGKVPGWLSVKLKEILEVE